MDNAQGLSQGQDTSNLSGLTSSVSQTQSAPVNTDERTFRQSEVNEIVKKAKYGAVEDYKRIHVEQPQYAQQKYGEVPSGITPNQSAHLPENEIRRLAAEEAQRLRDTWVQEARTKSEAEQAQRIVQNFWNKVLPGREKYQDFDKVTGDIEFNRFPNTVQLLSEHVDNTHDVLYELGKDRFKMAQLESLAYISPKDAIIQAQRLSQSIKDNESASKIKIPNEPLSQMRPSNTGTDNGEMSVTNLRSKYRG